jgi:hypothetical protein
MISEYNTSSNGSTPGKSGGMDLILKVAIVGVVLYFGYKYLIQKPADEEKK